MRQMRRIFLRGALAAEAGIGYQPYIRSLLHKAPRRMLMGFRMR